MAQLYDAGEGAALRAALLRFYAAAKRDLPWRQKRDPYAIWISEIMLQQTQVDTVVPRYAAFLQLFPSVQALAAASPEAVCAAWAGLGYYRRARNLHAAAQVICTVHAGQMPKTLPELLSLPGIGRYTAGAIASIAYDLPAPIVDGNVARVLARLYCLADAPASPVGRKFLWQTAASLVDGPRPGDLNQALMELGATVCTPRAPTCSACPVAHLCHAYRDGVVAAYPPVVPRKAPTGLTVAFAYVADGRGVWLTRRPVDAGLWAGLWELPSAQGDDAAQLLATRMGCALGPPLGTLVHVLTHRRVEATIYSLAADRGRHRLRTSPTMRRWEDPLAAPLSILARKAVVLAQAPQLALSLG